MNLRAVFQYVGFALLFMGGFMLIPLLISLYCGESFMCVVFGLTICVFLLIGTLLAYRRKSKPVRLQRREGFMVVALCWILVSVIGALPFYLSGEATSFLNALFESVSGFTTTAATTIVSLEALPRGLIFWMGFSHWVGGMGVIVFVLAVIPLLSGDHNVSVMRAETPGPSPTKLVPRLGTSIKILYGIYVGLSFLEFLFLRLGGMPLFDSVVTAMATAGTGGFSYKSASIAAYGSLYIEMVVMVFMILFSVNFGIYFLLLTRRFAAIRKNDELRWYLGIIAVCVVLIALNLYGSAYGTLSEAFRYASFQVSAVITTCGFVSADFSLWPRFSQTILLILAFVGASAGSTGGGIKIARVLILLREARRRLHLLTRPRSVESIRLNGQTVDKPTIHHVNTYMITFALLYAVSVLLVSLDNFELETSMGVVAACISNVGVGFGSMSAVGNYADFSALSKIVLILDMLLGRLEIYPVLLLFAPRTWRRMN